MRVRVKFAKYGPMKFIGHLELMRYLMSAVRRTQIPVKYDEGMHQRMIMSFAMPLGVGPTSGAEYMDIELEEPISTEKAMAQLEPHMCEGLDILDFREVDGGKKTKAMTIVAAADYEVWFREGFEPDWDWKAALKEFCGRKSIPWVKETKKGTREVDMREWIYDVEIREARGDSDSADCNTGPAGRALEYAFRNAGAYRRTHGGQGARARKGARMPCLRPTVSEGASVCKRFEAAAELPKPLYLSAAVNSMVSLQLLVVDRSLHFPQGRTTGCARIGLASS